MLAHCPPPVADVLVAVSVSMLIFLRRLGSTTPGGSTAQACAVALDRSPRASV
ncbi:hypothetical protein [Frankia sp. AgB32]|uniref:hypothetical protein n=1 Tax=Frankia sp. AgB32 TaxID=631119 RepID=UPI00200F87DC|nr:hypothetical protein [Frankia sp. AgB32]MCK9895525.1 hypothetical protein [Frankia sp. AgB32]